MEQSVESNFYKKFKAITLLLIVRPYFRFLFKKKDFAENPVNVDMGI